MNRTVALVLAGLLAVTVLPAAAAHVTVTSVPPNEPLKPGIPTAIPVTVSVNCAIYVAEYSTAQVESLDLALVATADGVEPPTYLPFVGETIPFTIDMCDPTSANVQGAGTVTITPSNLAPAFQPIPLQPGAVGETNEGGNFTLEVAYAWSAKLLETNLTAGEPGLLVFEVTANADTVLKLKAVGHGLTVPAEVDVPSPLRNGQATRRVEVAVTADHGGTYEVTVAAAAKGRDATGSPFTLSLAALPARNATADHGAMADDHHNEESKDSPAPVAPLLAVALLVLALRRRR
ncbi:MAG: hypothetical protein WC876_05490 [Candidatus Thermoplasmatota archaeon]|jgi:MYXO-CTERM domain-containing protein